MHLCTCKSRFTHSHHRICDLLKSKAYDQNEFLGAETKITDGSPPPPQHGRGEGWGEPCRDPQRKQRFIVRPTICFAPFSSPILSQNEIDLARYKSFWVGGSRWEYPLPLTPGLMLTTPLNFPHQFMIPVAHLQDYLQSYQHLWSVKETSMASLHLRFLLVAHHCFCGLLPMTSTPWNPQLGISPLH